MAAKLQGTVVFDGLVEGRVPHLPGAEEKLRNWAAEAQTGTLRFSLELDGGNFSVLADNQPVAVDKLDGRVDQVVTNVLADLLKTFPPAERTQVFSTLRSTEYRRGEEVQTLYAVGGDGRVVIEQRTVKAETQEPAAPLTRRERIMRVVVGVALAVGILGASTLIIDYPRLFRTMRGPHLPPAGVVVQADGFTDYFTVKKAALGPDGTTLILSLERTAGFPVDDPAVDAAATQAATRAATQPGGAIRSQMVLQSLARGLIYVEMVDNAGNFMGIETLRIAPLREGPTADLPLHLPVIGGEVRMPARLVIKG